MAMRRWTGLTWGFILLLAFVVSACAGPGTSSGTGGASVDCAKLARLGVKTCPPANPPMFNPKLVNDTNGQVSSDEFKAYAKGYLRNEAYQAFALNTNQPAMLRAGILTDKEAIDPTFGTGLEFLSEAASERGVLETYGPVLTALRLIVLPSNIQSDIQSVGSQPSRLGWVATFGGPATYVIVGPRFTVLESVSSRIQPYQDLSWGTYKRGSPLGGMWQFYGDTKCSADPVWQSICEQ